MNHPLQSQQLTLWNPQEHWTLFPPPSPMNHPLQSQQLTLWNPQAPTASSNLADTSPSRSWLLCLAPPHKIPYELLELGPRPPRLLLPRKGHPHSTKGSKALAFP